jgi:DNA polymerase III delta subunit
LDDALNGWRGAALDELAKLRQIEDANKFLGLLASQVYALAAAQASKDKSSTDVARDTGTHAFVMEKMFAVSRRVSGRDVARLAKLVAETDAKMKLGSDGWTLIEVLLAKI